jgi:hypothetical protein
LRRIIKIGRKYPCVALLNGLRTWRPNARRYAIKTILRKKPGRAGGRGNDLVVDRKTHDGEDRGNRGEVELGTSEGEG